MQHRSSIRVVPAWRGVDPGLRLFLPFLDAEIPLTTLARDRALTSGLDGSVELVAIQVIPFPCPLTPDSRTRLLFERLLDVDAPSQIVLTRNPREALAHLLPPGSLVMLPASRWFHAKTTLARQVRRAGHEVLTC